LRIATCQRKRRFVGTAAHATAPLLNYKSHGFHYIVSKTCHLKCLKIVNEITPKIYAFILEFHNTKFYIILFVIYGMK
jgi:hypothetical protein